MVLESGSVVAVPLVGCEPLQPPEATQVCASLAVHCKVARLPAGTLLWTACRVTAGAAAPPVLEVLPTSWPFDCSQAARAAKATHARLQRKTRSAGAKRDTRRPGPTREAAARRVAK